MSVHKPQPKFGWWGTPEQQETASAAIAVDVVARQASVVAIDGGVRFIESPRSIYDLTWNDATYIPTKRKPDWILEHTAEYAGPYSPGDSEYRRIDLVTTLRSAPNSAWVARAQAELERTGARRAIPGYQTTKLPDKGTIYVP